MVGDRARVRTALAGLAGIAVATFGFGLTYNTTASLPAGVYRILPLVSAPARGEVVGFCLDHEAAVLALRRGYVHPAGLPFTGYRGYCSHGVGVLGKPVAGIPGDTVEATEEGVRINGRLLRRSQILRRDRAGRALPAATGRRVLRPGEYWLQSESAANSYDSRIFGPVREDLILDRRVFLAGYRAVVVLVILLAGVVCFHVARPLPARPPEQQ